MSSHESASSGQSAPGAFKRLDLLKARHTSEGFSHDVVEPVLFRTHASVGTACAEESDGTAFVDGMAELAGLPVIKDALTLAEELESSTVFVDETLLDTVVDAKLESAAESAVVLLCAVPD